MYKLMPKITSPSGYTMDSPGIIRLSDNAQIPFEPGNRDYEKYLTWVEEGNTPEPADEIKPDYRTMRQTEYPSIGDQLDALFHAGLMPRDIAVQIQLVKTKYPKA